MAHLLIKITARVPLPKGTGAAVGETLRISGIIAHASNRLSDDKIENLVVITQEEDDAEPAPVPKRPRKPRAALGSSPLASAQTQQVSPPLVHRNSSAGNPQAGQPQTISTTGADGLSPAAGADPGEMPSFLSRRAQGAGT